MSPFEYETEILEITSGSSVEYFRSLNPDVFSYQISLNADVLDSAENIEKYSLALMGAVEILWKNADKRNGKYPGQFYPDRSRFLVRSGQPWAHSHSRNDFSFCSNTSWWLRMAWGWHLFMVQCWRQGCPDRTFVETRNNFMLSARVFVRGALVRFGKRGRVQLDICFKCNISNVVIWFNNGSANMVALCCPYCAQGKILHDSSIMTH